MRVFKILLVTASLPLIYLAVLFFEMSLQFNGQTVFDLLTQRKHIEANFDGFDLDTEPGEVVFFGSCDFQELFDEQIWKRSGFVPGKSITDAQTPVNSYFQLRSRLRKSPAPRLLVYLLDLDDFNFSGAFNFYLFAQNQPPDLRLVEQAISMRDIRMVNYLATRGMEELGLVRKRSAAPRDGASDGPEALPRPATRIPVLRERHANIAVQKDYLRRFVQLANRAGVPLMIVLNPARLPDNPELSRYVQELRSRYAFELVQFSDPLAVEDGGELSEQGQATIRAFNTRLIERARIVLEVAGS
ncbi:MAG: hypothetical protein A2X94_08425 [Bdellovibrionales bacterium GWB1_55_8]|nr:MAG: hypothetical protein A2X94_08425 [Bdellovibrionales bacterium GWB1_55_8]